MLQVGQERSEIIARYAGLQASAEIGIGTLMHTFHVPFGGHAMSLNQGFLLTLATRESKGRRLESLSVVLGVSGVASALKPLSPAGNRLGPMLAIAVQGVFFSLGLAFFGANAWGAVMGLAAASLWGFAQPLILGYLIFGTRLFAALEGLWLDLARTLGVDVQLGWKLLVAVVVIKAALAVGVACLGWWATDRVREVYRAKLSGFRFAPRRRRAEKGGSLAWEAVKDLSNRWYVASLAVTLGFLCWSGHASLLDAALLTLRAVIVGWLIFWSVRWLPVALQSPRVSRRLKRFPALVRAFERAAQSVR